MVIFALVAACVSVVLSVTLPLLLRDSTLRSAFTQLESDYEELQETVRSALGRVARLKRGIMRGEVPPQEGAETEPVATSDGNNSAPSLSPGQLAWQRRILSRRHQP